MEKGLVSVITPAYNCAKFIGETIESVQAQTYQQWEMIMLKHIEVPYYKFGLKELELELEKKSGKIMRLLNKLSPLKKYLILQPQLNGVGINVEKILEDLKK